MKNKKYIAQDIYTILIFTLMIVFAYILFKMHFAYDIISMTLVVILIMLANKKNEWAIWGKLSDPFTGDQKASMGTFIMLSSFFVISLSSLTLKCVFFILDK